MENKPNIPFPVIVEGKYDRNTLLSVINAKVIPVGGFSVFNNVQTRELILRLADKGKIILLTDSDGGGIQIRSFVERCVPRDRIINLYIPKIQGKEKRKKKRGKAGLLGVEGMTPDIIRNIFLPVMQKYTDNISEAAQQTVTKADFYADGFSGRENSAQMRKTLSDILSLPSDISANALIEAINLICSRKEYESARAKVWEKTEITEKT